MPSFAAKSGVRAWAYTIARNALGQELRGQKRYRAQRCEFSDTLASRIADQVRTETAAWHRTEVKDEFLKLQQELDHDEQELLFLRTNQQLGWNEIAEIRLGEAAAPAALKREAARLRKRFQLTREKIRKLARERGLLGDSGPAGSDSS
jgi:RNA polymerase sigma-70 factor (ECF subfamily)